MVVQVVPIQMRGHEHLKAVAPEPLRGLHADLMAFLRRDLSGLEALIAVPGDVSAGLVILLLGQLHLLHGGLRQTVDPGHELSVRGCLRPLHIARRVGEILQIRNGAGFLRVLSVIDHISEVAGNVPQLRRRHQRTSSGSIVKALCRATMDSSSRRASSALPS